MAKPWNEHRTTITKLYIQEGRTLEDVRGIMKTNYNFKASIRSYRKHFDIWNISKYNCKKRPQRRRHSPKAIPQPPLRSPTLRSSSDTGPSPASSCASQHSLEQLSLPAIHQLPGRSTAPTLRSRRSSSRNNRSVVGRDMVEAPQGVTAGGSDEEKVDGALGDDVYYVEMIKGHRPGKNGGLEFQVKWEGYEEKGDLTWEPEENLTVSGKAMLNEYFGSIGRRPKPKTCQESGKAANTKKRVQTSQDVSGTTLKRLRQSEAHATDESSLATTEKWKPPSGSWEDEIEKIDGCEKEGNGKMIVYLVWKNGQKTGHETQVIYKKCPQKMLQFYEARIKIIKKE